MPRMSPEPKRGRPPKFGRPGRLLAFTVPDDVRAWLASIHPDPGWALVSLFDGATLSDAQRHPPKPTPVAEIALLARRRGLILVNRREIPAIAGVVLIPLSETQAFLALEPGKGLADIELSVIDAIGEAPSTDGRRSLEAFRDLLREWRKDPQWRFESRAIVVAERREIESPQKPKRVKARR